MGNNTKSLSELHNLMEVPIDGSTSALRVVGNFTPSGSLKTIELPAHDLSLAPLEYITSETENFFLRKVMIHFDSPVIEDITFYEDNTGATRDFLAFTDNTSNDGGVTGETDFAFFPLNEWKFNAKVAGQQFKMTISNNGLSGIAYVNIDVELVV